MRKANAEAQEAEPCSVELSSSWFVAESFVYKRLGTLAPFAEDSRNGPTPYSRGLSKPYDDSSW